MSMLMEAQAATCTKAHRQRSKTRHGTRISTRASTDLADGGEAKTPSEVEVRVRERAGPAQIEQQMRKLASILAPIGATENRKYRGARTSP